MARDPYKYYRIEARELVDGLAKGVLQLEKAAATPEAVAHLLRLAHTLKGAARVVKQAESADLAHRFEDVLSNYRTGGAVPAGDVDSLLKISDELSAQIEALAAPAQAPAVPAPGAPQPQASQPVSRPAVPATARERFESVRVEIGEMDSLLAGVSEVGVQVTALRQHAQAIERGRLLASTLADQLTPAVGASREVGAAALARARGMVEELQGVLERSQRGLSAGLNRSETELRQVRDKANTLRLVAAGGVFDSLERAARDAAHAGGKSITFESSGAEHRLDAHVLAPLADALLHVVRNAADHGIEAPAERAASGKPAEGRIRLAVEQRGGRILFRCSDDGRGIDVQSVRAAALRTGKLAPAEAASLDLQGAVNLLLRGGVSTKKAVTEISGRGVGLDVMRVAVEKLKGTLAVQSTPGKGTVIEISVPLSLTALSVLLVEAGGLTAALPMEAVRRSLRVADADISRSPQGETLIYDGRAIPFAVLSDVLGRDSDGLRTIWTVVVIEARNGWTGIGVERLIGRADIVVRPLPAAVGRIATVSGAALDADGDPQPVLDPEGLVEAARRERTPRNQATALRRPHVLVIDDSLTTRMLEQSILESAGYEVTLATSAEEGLEFAQKMRYDLFVVDIEMPGMNGFEFVSRTRADPVLRETPAVLVSSLNSDADKKRGAEAGARAYIVKGEFDQGGFLQTVRGLAG